LRFAQIVFLDPQNAPKSLAAGAFAPDPTGRAYSAPQTPYSWFTGPTSKWRGREGEGRVFHCVVVLEG